ncbi:MAG: 30S ribosomal protein S15 [Deltaproteobacteria bacterium]|nr:30S ribosomal protein S15 [Deltaproteobacteria bacterium]
MVITAEKKQELIGRFKTSKEDTGSPEVQIALLSNRIQDLKGHFTSHKKDHSSRRGLLKMVGQRRKLLNYLKKTNNNRYKKLIEDLGLRK